MFNMMRIGYGRDIHEIVVGVVAIPCSGDIYYASKGDGAFVIRNGISTKICVNKKLDDLTFLVSHFHNTEKVMKYAALTF